MTPKQPPTARAARRKAALAGESDPALIATDVRVEFRPFVERKPTLKSVLTPWRRTRFTSPVVAVDGASLTIRKGEAFGIVGSNGAGKSTLLRVLSGTFPPTSGSVEVFGVRPQLLALGVGMNKQLTGRRNVYLGGLAAGMRKAEIDERFQSILDYSEIGDAIDRPVSTYSSGMYSRLAFAVAIQTRPDLLLLDEVLSPGDASFKKKSRQTMTDILEESGTIIMVSHGLPRLQKFCDRVAWMDKGRIIEVGDSREVVEHYKEFVGVDDDSDDDDD